jgi:predicted Ser/Thr protein kinase
MILDNVFSGVLDQGNGGCLEVYDDVKADVCF